MPRDREHLLALVEGLRAEMNSKLDALVAAIREDVGEAQDEVKKPPRKRRAPLRPPVAAPVLLTDDIARKKAEQALQRMGLVRVKR